MVVTRERKGGGMKRISAIMLVAVLIGSALLVSAVPAVLACTPGSQLTMSASASEVNPGGSVDLDIREANTGEAGANLTGVYVDLSDGSTTEVLTIVSASFDGISDTDGDGILDVGEVWHWVVTRTINDTTTFTATAHGFYAGADVTYPDYPEQAEVSVSVPEPPATCRWTGGGTIGSNRDPRVTHGFELHCCVDQLPNNLEVSWVGDHFHLDKLTMVECADDPTIDPRPPRAGCDTIHGLGDGKYNGVSGYLVEFIFTDAGEPGRVDWAWIRITAPNGDTVMEVSGFLRFGNIEALNG